MDTGRNQSIGHTTAEIPRPPGPERPPGPHSTPTAPTVHVSQASAWVADLRRTIRDFDDEPLVRVTLSDGEQFFLTAVSGGPGEGFVTLHACGAEEATARVLVVPLDAIGKVEILREPPDPEAAYRFR